MDADVTEDALLKIVQDLNSDPLIDGILVQLPLPDHINQKNILEAIDVSKDGLPARLAVMSLRNFLLP